MLTENCTEFKKCSHCKETFPLVSFRKDKQTKDGLSSWCCFCILESNKRDWANHKEKRKIAQTKYKEEHKEQLKLKNKLYRSNPERKVAFNLYFKNWLKNPSRKISHSMSVLLGHALKGKRKTVSSPELLGCDLPTLKNYLEAKFKPGMTWENYGFFGWHVDHIKPTISFDLTKLEEQRKCFHYTNLQPLWADENWSKNSKYEGILYRNTSKTP